MSKALDATCSNGVVKVGSVTVPGAAILSEGIGSSSGVMIMDEDRATYIARTTPDLKTALEKIATALTQIATALTALDSKPLGTLAPSPSSATAIAQITSIQADLTTLKEALK